MTMEYKNNSYLLAECLFNVLESAADSPKTMEKLLGYGSAWIMVLIRLEYSIWSSYIADLLNQIISLMSYCDGLW